ncbi:hypothetical protein METBIDRAFT_32471 [Metschnikowia bicuspidata var. bicuspidata NRRL YB-4993]|uniref:Uncharacterized protein n=1 Tax=Metschnikowia bicuspidata var. bicuspidata NRRL YB-4993 TaxID=869754 RepID=A0A1A0H9A3_9ASCO|nr:hypothetical protein METBIDRAFT_32471 [Metschnikowia bicuspidata var. bicuspidata NRRL YB-4993]OBA20467.1 hypothetical protein METBIDRAFT_32471 [Metschnikowia bicuspidata var. bicuspidata NRRL YB-4993]
MDRDFTLERHLLARSFATPAEIQHILDARYKGTDAGDAYLVLLPTARPEGAKQTATRVLLDRNVEAKPCATRKHNARQQMKAYIKRTLAAQRRLVAKVQQARRTLLPIDVDRHIAQYGIPRFDAYVHLHGLWQKYIQDLLFADQKNPNMNMVMPRLATADFNGCWLRVVDARDRNLVGAQGIVLYDSQHSFMVVAPPATASTRTVSPAQRVGGLRVLSKRGTMFAFDVDVSATESVAFTILGSRFELRAVDRASKKFKSHGVEDIY